MPPRIGTVPPHTPEPPPYGTIGTVSSRATRTMAATSRSLSGHTTTWGRSEGSSPARTPMSRRGHMSRP